jgi:hypothetical protein
MEWHGVEGRKDGGREAMEGMDGRIEGGREGWMDGRKEGRKKGQLRKWITCVWDTYTT